jgi:hypothetical protein
VAKWVFAREKLPGQSFTDHRHAGPAGGVGIAEQPATQKFRLERGQIFRAHMAFNHLVVLALERPPFDLDIVCSAGALRWEHAGQSRRLYPRQARNAANNFTLKSYDLLIILVRSIGSHYSHGRQMAWIEAQPHVQQPVKALAQEARTGEQHYRDCQFHHHHLCSEPLPELTGGAAIPVTQSITHPLESQS